MTGETMIYLDNAATTKPLPEVVEAMTDCLKNEYGNPSAIYGIGSSAKKIVNSCKRTIAGFLGAEMQEIFFTSGGTEADNWALKAVCDSFREKGNHIITSKIEHHAILHTCQYLERKGFTVTYLEVDETGMISLEELEKAIRPDTVLISIMFANNEIGTVEPVKEIGEIAKKHGILFHTDAVQAFGHLPIDVNELHIDMLSVSGHKLYGPKGIGFLYIRNGIKIGSMIQGGAQERNRRAGTENVPAIAGLEAAVIAARDKMQQRALKERELRDYLIHRIETEIPYCRLNGHRERRLSNNVSFSFRFVEGETIIIMLNGEGICASSGSACTSGALDPSHVMLAIGCSDEEANGSLRMTVSFENTMEEMDLTVEKLKAILEKLRSMSHSFEEFKKRNGL